MSTDPEIVQEPATLALQRNSIVGINIEALLAKAIDAKSAVEVLERLMVMRKEAKAEAAKEAFDSAMAAFQAECPIIHKSAEVQERDSTKVRYRYAPLDAIVAQVKPLLEKHGLSHKEDARVEPEWVTAVCKVTHKAGHSESSEFRVPIDPKAYMNAAQKFASALTFAKRYAFCAAFGILTGDADDDANSTGEPKQRATPRAQAPTQALPVAQSKPVPAPANGNVKASQCATADQKAKLLDVLAPQRELAERYMRAIDWLLPTESIESLDLVYVPATKRQFDMLIAQLDAVARGEIAVAPYPPNQRPLAPEKLKPAPEAAPQQPAPTIDPSWQAAEGVVELVNLKEGKKKDGTGWSLWGIKLGGEWHNSFSNRIGHFARDAYHAKQPVKLYYTLDKENRREAQEIV